MNYTTIAFVEVDVRIYYEKLNRTKLVNLLNYNVKAY